MIECHLLKLRARTDINAAEEQAIRDLVSDVREHPADTVIVKAGDELSASTLLIDGILARSHNLAEGGRQITELHVAGDFADLHGFTLKRLDHDLVTMSKCRTAVVPHDRLIRLTEEFPHVARCYWFGTNLDAAIHRVWEVSLGRRRASPRMAHLFCEMHVRLGIVGLTDGLSFNLPLTQDELADCLGLTAVHVNRTLKDLRERELIDFRSGRVIIHDLDGLRELAEFDPAYLYLEKRPR
ncbi:Crp/Fnr family transcriptional regulator [Sphingomonas piscis]|uniref:Crp/Fnr family transcriptional regulator n=1 Tax=Sphingomonas piscis TaxID=2714943 RepID=UPI001FE6320B|nr:Crp/Fnr family transcriptional regulator [Sphingomonas piscis]